MRSLLHSRGEGKPETASIPLLKDSVKVIFLDCSARGLGEFPLGLLQLDYLEELHLERNLIQAVPADIGLLQKLQVLYLQENCLDHVCEELGQLSQLRSLDLSVNPLVSSGRGPLLATVQRLTELRELRLHGLGLTELPEGICKTLHKLELLGLSGNGLAALPPEISNLRCLREIYLHGNRLEAMPPGLCDLPRLEIVDVGHNSLASLNNKACGHSWKKLFLAFNRLYSFPRSPHLGQLTILDMSHNGLTRLPRTFLTLTSLVELGLSDNPLRALPPQICHLPSLRVLYLRNTKLSGLHPNFSNLHKLQVLDLSQNRFAEFPTEVCTLTSLEQLSFDDNYLKEVVICSCCVPLTHLKH